MATYLDVLVELLTDPASRAAYQREPAGWLRDAGLGYLCGEDVVAAGPILRGWLPDLSSAFDALDGIEPAPEQGEAELDAAIRIISTLCAKVPLEDPEEDSAASVG